MKSRAVNKRSRPDDDSMPRSTAIMVRVRPSEQDEFVRCAERRGLTLSSWVRMELLSAARRYEKAGM